MRDKPKSERRGRGRRRSPRKRNAKLRRRKENEGRKLLGKKKQRDCEKKPKKGARQRHDLLRLNPPFPSISEQKKAAKAARKKANRVKRRQKLEGPSKAEKAAAAEKLRLEAEAEKQARRACCSGLCGVVVVVLVILIAVVSTHFLAHNHKQFVPQHFRDHLAPYVESTVDYFNNLVAPAVRHVHKMNADAIEDQKKEQERQARHGHGEL